MGKLVDTVTAFVLMLVIAIGCYGIAVLNGIHQSHFSAFVPHEIPNPSLTPGSFDPAWTVADVERPGGTQWNRNVDHALKVEVWESYGYDKFIGPYDEHAEEFEIDHLIPNSLAGKSELANLWPQPYAGKWNAHMKDRLEVHVRAMVIDGKMSLADAQKCFTPDWRESYKRFHLGDTD